MPIANNLEINSLLDHPKIQQMIGEIRDEQATKQRARTDLQLDVMKIRSEQLAGYRHSLTTLIDIYEEKRKDLHSLLGDIYVVENQMSHLTGQASCILEEMTFRRINLPRLAPARPGMQSNMDVGVTTTDAAVAGFFAAYGKGWPFLGDA